MYAPNKRQGKQASSANLSRKTGVNMSIFDVAIKRRSALPRRMAFFRMPNSKRKQLFGDGFYFCGCCGHIKGGPVHVEKQNPCTGRDWNEYDGFPTVDSKFIEYPPDRGKTPFGFELR